MYYSFLLNRQILALLIPLLLFSIIILFVNSQLFNSSSNILITAVSLDLLITIPLIYFFIIRKTRIPYTTIVPMMVLGSVIGLSILPEEKQLYFRIFQTWFIPVIEIFILGFLVIKVRKIIKEYKKQKNFTPDFFSAVKEGCKEILPKRIVIPFATELAVIYYGFFNWKKPELRNYEFSYHKKTGTAAIIYAFIFVILIETVAVHFLLADWSNFFAWTLSILSLYTVLQLIGSAKSLSRRPILLLKDKIILRYGILNETTIKYRDIDKIEFTNYQSNLPEGTRRFSPLGEMESHNLFIGLKKENTLTGLYGFKKRFDKIALHIDEKEKFKTFLEDKMSNYR